MWSLITKLFFKRISVNRPKPFVIEKALVWEAYKLVKANKGGCGVDRQSLAEFNKKRNKNLYKIWNRLSSGSYMPPAVRGVEIPKKQGGTRLLGVPTVSDRIAQMTIKLMFEPLVEPCFLDDSYGYRPNKSALDAVGVTRKRCWQYDWVIEFDIKGLFDNIDHELLMKAVRHHTDNKCILLYIQRWITTPIELPDGAMKIRTSGTPQGGVISPVLSNLFLHYVFDIWVTRKYPYIKWCRYADDGLIHCRTQAQAELILQQLEQRFRNCELELHPEKTKIIYCQDKMRTADYQGNIKFEFLGYEFRPRMVENPKTKHKFLGFTPAISPKAKKAIMQTLREMKIYRKTDISLQQIAESINPKIRGWINYYGQYTKSALNIIFQRINAILVRWSIRKYKTLQGRLIYATNCMKDIAKRYPNLFTHWKYTIGSVFI
jgi:RNA-directed DNA polymerase